MRIVGTRSHDILTNDIDEMIKYCKTHKIDGLHVALYRSFSEEFENTDKMIEYAKKLEENGIEIFIHGAYFNMIHPDFEKVEAGRKLFKTIQKIAHETNGKYVASETGSLNGDAWTYNSGNHTEESFTKVLETTEFLRDSESVVVVETVYDHVIYNIEYTKKLTNENDEVKLILDLSNLLNTENFTDYLKIFEEYIKTFKEKIVAFHCKNFNWKDNEKIFCALDEGILNYEKLIKIIDENSCQSIPLIIEDLQNEELEKSIKYLKEL